MIIDLPITVGIPVLQMGLGKRDLFLLFSPRTQSSSVSFCILEFIVAGHRFNIFEDYGCGPATVNTLLSYVLVWSWPLVIGVISAGYGCKFAPAFPPLRALNRSYYI
jgi:hypothetical protein